MGIKIKVLLRVSLLIVLSALPKIDPSLLFAQSEDNIPLSAGISEDAGQQGNPEEPAQEQALKKPVEESAEDGIKLDKEKISLDLKGVDIIELFRILSQKMNLTIVPTKSVAGRVNIFLNNLSFQDALDVVLISQDLASDRKGNIVNVMTSSEYDRLFGKKYNEKRKFSSVKLTYAKPSTVFNVLGQIKSDIGRVIVDESTGTIFLIDIPEKIKLMEDTISALDRVPEVQVFDIKYAKPADMKTQLSAAITSGTGELIVDERASKMVISDLPDKMKKLKKIIRALDEPSRQVFVEAEILEITLKKEYQRGGINWEGVFKKLNGLDFKGTFPIAASFTPSPLLSAANLAMSVGTLSSNKYTATMQLLETYGDTKILSRPKIMVVNNQEAKVLVGSREAYVSQSQSQSDVTTVTSENIQFIDVGVKLNVVPTINVDGFINMKIKPEVSSVRETLTTALGSKVPIVETSEAETSVKVKDGTMIMIAGLMRDERHDDTSGIPWIGKIPVIGAFFGSKANQTRRRELIIFLTPYIVSGDRVSPGEEPEKLIPREFLTGDLLEKIAVGKAQEIPLPKQKIPSGTLPPEKAVPAGSTTSSNFQDKMKGMK